LAVAFERTARAQWLKEEWFVAVDDPDSAWTAAESAREFGLARDADDLEAIAMALEVRWLSCRSFNQAQHGTEPIQLTFTWSVS
jgi:hypothetical protein